MRRPLAFTPLPVGPTILILFAVLLLSPAPGGLASEGTAEPPAETVVTGRVTDLEGAPIAGARLRCSSWGGSHHSATADSDETGQFSVDARPGKCRLFVAADGHAASYATRDVAAGANPGWHFVLPRSGRVSGRVVDSNGKPQSGRTLELWALAWKDHPTPGAGYWSGGDSMETDEKGAFDLVNVAPGRHRVIVYRPSPLGGDRCMQQVPVTGRFLEARSREHVSGLEIVVAPPKDTAISGRVLTAEGEPVPGVMVDSYIPHGRHWWTKTDEDGAYRIEGLDGIGRSTVRLYFRDYRLSIPDVALGSENVDLVLPGSGTIAGSVRDAGTGVALPEFSVEVPVVTFEGSGAIWEKPTVTVRPGEGGAFTITGVPAGEVVVEVRAKGVGAQRFVTHVEAGGTSELDCGMRGAAVLAGRTSVLGEPTRTAIVIDGKWRYTEDDGSFLFDDLPNGDHLLWFFQDPWLRTVPVKLRSGETTRFGMELGGSVEIRGTVVFPQEEERFCTVRLAAREAPDGWFEFGRPEVGDFVLTHAKVRKSGGEFHLTRVPPGRWHLMVGSYRPSMHRSLLRATKVIEVKEGESMRVDFD